MLKRLRVQTWAEFSRAVKTGATAGKVAATVVSRMERRTKTGNKMGIMGLSDPTGHFEAVLFSEGLAQYRDVLEPGAAVLLQLGAELQGEDVRARVLHAEPLDDAAAKTQKGLRIFVRDPKPLDSIARRLNMPEAAASGGPAKGLPAKPAPAPSGGADGDVSLVIMLDLQTEVEDEAAGALQGLAADRRCDQGGGGRGGRADAVVPEQRSRRKRHRCYCNLTMFPAMQFRGKYWGRYVGAWNCVAVGCVVVIGLYDRQSRNRLCGDIAEGRSAKAGQSRVVVLQQKRDGLSMAICACDVKLDGSPMGKVMVGTYAYADLPAGPHQLVASEVLFPGDTRRDFTTAPGRTYFFSRQVQRKA